MHGGQGEQAVARVVMPESLSGVWDMAEDSDMAPGQQAPRPSRQPIVFTAYLVGRWSLVT